LPGTAPDGGRRGAAAVGELYILQRRTRVFPD
jgi:hypothetical protein